MSMQPSATLYLERISLLSIINKSILLLFFPLLSRIRRKDSCMHMNKQSLITPLSSILCLIVMLLAACGQTSTANHQKAPENKQVLVSGSVDINTFDPALANDLNSASAIQMVFT